MSNTVSTQQILQALAQRMAAARGQGSLSGIPGAAPPQGQAPISRSPMPQAGVQQGGMPGAVQPQIQSQPPAQAQGAARQLSPASPTPFSGTFGDRRGIISQLVNSAEKSSHDKKVNEAEMYYNQINSFLASGKPEDQQSAQRLLDDPKVRKVLKQGLDYKPLEEEPPPEAIGIQKAQQKITQKQTAIQKLQQLLTGGQKQGSAQPRPPGRAVIPGPSQQAQGQYAEQQAKIGTQQAEAQKDIQEGNRADAQAAAEKVKADAEVARVESEKIRNQGLADEARSHAKLYDKQADTEGDLNPLKAREAEAHANEMNAMANYHTAMAKYVTAGKLPGSKIQDLMKGQRADITAEIKAYRADNTEAMKEMAKNPWYRSDKRLQKLQDDAGKKAKDLAAALAWYDGEGMQAVLDGKMTPPEAYAKAHRMAGIDAPPPTADPNAPPSGDLGAPPGFIKMPDGTYQEQ